MRHLLNFFQFWILLYVLQSVTTRRRRTTTTTTTFQLLDRDARGEKESWQNAMSAKVEERSLELSRVIRYLSIDCLAANFVVIIHYVYCTMYSTALFSTKT